MNSFGEVFEMVKTYCLEVANVGDIAFKQVLAEMKNSAR